MRKLNCSNWLEAAVEDINRAVAEVRRVQVRALVGRTDGEAFIDRGIVPLGVVDRDDGAAAVHSRIPAGDRAALGGEQENGRCRDAALRNVESGSAVIEHLSRRRGRVCLPHRCGDGDRIMPGYWNQVPGAVIDRGHAAAVVGNPERSGRAVRYAPRIDQVVGDMRGRHRAIGHQVCLGIGCFLLWPLMMAMVMSVIVRERSWIIAHGCFLPRICNARWSARQDPATEDTKGTLLTNKS